MLPGATAIDFTDPAAIPRLSHFRKCEKNRLSSPSPTFPQFANRGKSAAALLSVSVQIRFPRGKPCAPPQSRLSAKPRFAALSKFGDGPTPVRARAIHLRRR